MSRFSVPLGALRDRRFRLFWTGQTLSNLGSSVLPVSLTIAIVRETGSAIELGAVLAVSALAEVVFMLVGGVWADRLPRQLVMLLADAVRCCAHVFIGLEMILGVTSIPHLMIAAAFTGTASAFFHPASSGLIPATVDPPLLQQANALVSVSRRASLLVGPSLATMVALTIGPGWAVLLDGLTFAGSVATLAFLKVAFSPKERQGFVRELRYGWNEVSTRLWLWSNIIVHGVWNLARCVYFTVGPVVVITQLGGEIAWGMIAQGATIGALGGAVLALKVQPRRPLVVANLCLALGALPLLGIAVSAPAMVIAVAAALMSMVLGLMGTLWDTTLQEQIPADAISRVSAYDWVASLALNPVGMALAGPLAVMVGAKQTLLGAAAVMAVFSLGALLVKQVWSIHPRSRRQDDVAVASAVS